MTAMPLAIRLAPLIFLVTLLIVWEAPEGPFSNLQ